VKELFINHPSLGEITDNLVSTVTGWTAKVYFQAEVRASSVFHSIQTGSETHLISYPVGTGGSFPRCKVSRA
jgi:hypothetical protein